MFVMKAFAPVTLCLAGFVGIAAAQPPASSDARLDALLERAAGYVAVFVERFSSAVCEERYVQDATGYRQTARAGQSGRPWAAGPPAKVHRELKSDFLLVELPGSTDWAPFRDVFEVDGAPVRDRAERLTKLLRNPTKDTIEQAERIRDESARYNIGNLQSTINNPMLAIAIVQSSYQPRFKFSLGLQDRSAGPDVWIVDYKEQGTPTLVKDTGNRNIFAHGRIWIDASTGRVPRTELSVELPTVRAHISTSFQLDDQFGVDVPAEMQEEYVLGYGAHVTGVATYGRFRRFPGRAKED